MKYIKITLLAAVLILTLVLIKSQLPALTTFAQEDSELSRVIYVIDNLNDELITHVDTGGKKLVALTFDDGPDPLYTPEVMEILKLYQIKATFFVVGESVAAQSELLQQEIKEGHEIENHTYTHPDLSRESDLQTAEEIRRTGQVIYDIGKIKTQYFRPPKKMFRQETIQIAKVNGYKTVLWTICVENHKTKTPEQMAQRVINSTRPGMIILAHDGRLDRSQTLAALPMIIEGLQEKGYEFITLNELLNTQVEK